jgi:RimJ/RimL family protein N-acetyltransferase
MDITFRAFDPNIDHPGMVELHNQIFPERPLTLEERLENERLVSPEMVRQRTIGIRAGALVAMVAAGHAPGNPMGEFFINCWISREVRGQGIGKKMTLDAIAYAVSQGAQKLMTWVREDDTAALHFAESFGFCKETLGAENALLLESFEIAAFHDTAPGLMRQGFVFTDFARWGDTPEHRYALHEMFLALSRDAPHTEFQPSFEDWQRFTFERQYFQASGVQLVLAAQGNAIGLSCLDFNPNSNESFCDGTWVHADHRGQGIAFALKLAACRWALARGVKKIVTGNDASNVPMLAINHKLGFKLQVGFWQMQRLMDTGSRENV